MSSALHLEELQMTMGIRNTSMVDTVNQHTFAVNALADLRPMSYPTAMQIIDNVLLRETSAHGAVFQELVPAMKKMDTLAMINAVMKVVVVFLCSIAFVNDVSDDCVEFVVSLKFSVCDVAGICSQDVLSYAVPYDIIK